jgi:hypothetical protein
MTFTVTIETNDKDFLADPRLDLSWMLHRLAETVAREVEPSTPFACVLHGVRGDAIGQATLVHTKRRATASPRATRSPKAVKRKARTTKAARKR